MPPNNEGDTKPRGWKKILAHEMFEYFFNFAFLAFFLIAFAWYRRLILAEYHIRYLSYWVPLIEAAVLAKVIMIGDALRMGRELRSKPLIVTTIYRTIVFSTFVGMFTVVEHIVGALLHHKSVSEGIEEITSKGWYELVARCVLILAAFLPFFGFKEIGRVFGEEKIRGMFFRGHVEGS
jgi:hypothetical protein